jgi:hypothetical protein
MPIDMRISASVSPISSRNSRATLTPAQRFDGTNASISAVGITAQPDQQMATSIKSGENRLAPNVSCCRNAIPMMMCVQT